MNNKTIEQKIQRTEKEITRLEHQKKIKQHEAKQLERNRRNRRIFTRGGNEVGKSSILEAIDLVASGSIKKVESMGLDIIKQHDLSRQITTLTEEIEELRSEKENLLLDLGCADDAGVKAVQSEVAAMEASLHKLDEQKERYSAELDETLQQYKQLQNQVEAEDQQKIRTNAAAAASARLQQAYGKHYNAQLARESQQDVASWLGELTQPASIREFLHRAEKKMYSTPKHSKDTPER